jgi:methyl-accepting chemotaxis protein
VFFGNTKELEERIKQLEEENSNLKNQVMVQDTILDEINDVLEKTSKGLCGFKVNGSTSNIKINEIISNLNNAVDYYKKYGDEAVEILIAYGNANFSFDVETKGLSGKLGSVILGIRSLGSSISELIALMDVSSNELNTQAEQMQKASGSLATASNESAASLEETAAALEEVTSTIINNSENTQKMSLYANKVIESAKSGQQMSNETDKAMDEIKEQVQSINDAITVIDQIAFQTNILSLNAAVEAATAGEAGKGFAVVAQEVRNLANRSAEAAKDIKNIVESATLKTNEGKVVAEKMTQGYEELYSNIDNTIELINQVSSASQEQKQAIEQINDAVTHLDQSTQQNAAAANQISSQSNIIYELAQKLLNTVNHTQYQTSAKEQICNTDQLFTLNSLKLDHINFKDNNFKRLGERTKFSVVDDSSCKLGQWITEQEKQGKEFTKTSNWNKLKEVHKNVHGGVQNIVNKNADGDKNILQDVENIDQAISEVFWSIQQIKKDDCKNINIQRGNDNQSMQYTPSLKPKKVQTNNIQEIVANNKDDDEWASF